LPAATSLACAAHSGRNHMWNVVRIHSAPWRSRRMPRIGSLADPTSLIACHMPSPEVDRTVVPSHTSSPLASAHIVRTRPVGEPGQPGAGTKPPWPSCTYSPAPSVPTHSLPAKLTIARTRCGSEPMVPACENRAPSQHTRPPTLPTHGAPSGPMPIVKLRLER